MDTPRRVLTLVRVSGKAQIDRTGIPRQIEAIEEIKRVENLYTASDADKYKFEGLSGASVDRFPEFNAMLKRLDDPQIAGIVFSEVSRLFRPEYPDQLHISKPFRVNGKLMWYEDGVLDLRKEKDQGIFYNEAQKAGAHRKRIIQWTQWGRNERRKMGNCSSDPLPQGVTFFPHPKVKEELITGHFVYTNDIHTEKIKEAYRRLLAGQSYSQIARDLQFGRPGKPNHSVVVNYLRSRWWIGEKASLYYRKGVGMREDGTMYHGKRKGRDVPYIVKANFNCDQCNVHQEPLVSRADFDAVQAILDVGEKRWSVQRAQDPTTPYLGKGILYCPCGLKIYTKPVPTPYGKINYYYRCSSYNNGHEPCGAPHLKQAEVDRELTVYAVTHLTNRKYIQSLSSAHPKVNTSIIEKQIAAVGKRLDALYEKIGDPQWDQKRIEANIKKAEAEKVVLDGQLQLAAQPVAVSLDADAIRSRFLNFRKLPLREQKEAITKTFAKVVLDPVAEDEDGNAGVSIVRVELRAKTA